MARLNCLEAQDNAAPRAVVFRNENDPDDVQVYITADNNKKIEITSPTPAKVLLGLLATYYAWHQAFPAAYKQSLELFSHKILKTEVSLNSGVGKFLRQLRNMKSLNNKENEEKEKRKLIEDEKKEDEEDKEDDEDEEETDED